MPLWVREKVQEVLRQGTVSGSEVHPPWYGEGLRFACTQCGDCCSGAPGYVWVDGDDIRLIAGHVGLTPEEFQRRHVRRAGRGWSLREKPGGDCEFLQRNGDGKTACRIHPVRPVQCRTWPFWKSNLSSPATWQETARHCPGMNAGALHPGAVIQNCLRDNGDRPL